MSQDDELRPRSREAWTPGPDPSQTPLFRLVRTGRVQSAEVQLRRLGRMPDGMSVNAREEEFGWGMLHFAAHKGHTGLVQWLLKQKARTDLTDAEGNTPLILCAKSNHIEALELLLARGASITQRTKESNFTPLLWAAAGGHFQATKSLLEADGDVEDRDFEDRTPLMWAARHGHLAVVKLLLQRCPDLTRRDQQGATALDHCREQLELRATVVMAQELGRRLGDGAQRNDIEVVEHLLKHRAEPRYKDAQGWTPLTWALLHGSSEMAFLLVRYGAHPELLGENADLGHSLALKGRQVGKSLAAVLGANTRLLEAAQASQLSEAQLALDQGACPDARQGFDGGGGGLAARGVTAAQRCDEVLQGAEEALVCGREPMGEGSGRHMTATMWAARRGQAELLRLLGQRQADVNLRDTRGWTAVLWGALKGDAESISVLHHFKADLKTKSLEGESPLHMTVRCDHDQALQLLLAARGNVEERNVEGQAPLHCAAAHGSTRAATVLLHFGGNVKAKDPLGQWPIFVASCGVHPKACEVLTSRTLEALAELPVELPPEEIRAAAPDAKAAPKGKNAPKPGSRQGKTIMPRPKPKEDSRSSPTDSRRTSEASRRPSRDEAKWKRQISPAEVSSRSSNRAPSEALTEKTLFSAPEEPARPIGQELLILAAKKGRALMSKPQTGPGDFLSEINGKGWIVLHAAATAGQSVGHFKVLSTLVDLKANCNIRDRHGVTPLMQAAELNYSEAVDKMLAQESTKVSEKDNLGRTAAELAASPVLRATLQRVLVQERSGIKGKKPVNVPPSSEKQAIFRVRMEALPTKLPPEELERKIQVLLKKVVVKAVHLEVVRDPIMGQPRGRGHCYIDFLDSQSSEKALELDGSELGGQKIRVCRDMALAMVQ